METVTLGPAGSYSHRAARAVSNDVSFRESPAAIVEAVATGAFDRGIVAIENSIDGSVKGSLDALVDFEVAVVREVVTPIRHGLIAQSEDFDVVASHTQALAQCRSYLEEEYPDVELEAVTSTARGVQQARENPRVAAIGHPDNAEDGLQLLADDIQDRESNATRFFVVAPMDERSEAGGKSSLIINPNADYAGLLLELLEAFADRDINLSRIESRPTGDRLGDYLFHVDIEAGLYEERTEAALTDVEEIAANGWVRRLGSYDVEHVI